MNRTEITEQIDTLIRDLIYVSESERPLSRLQWDASTPEELMLRIASFTGLPVSAQVSADPEFFFAAIQNMADPADEAMCIYASRYATLHAFLRENLQQLQVIQAGQVQVHVFITGFTREENQAVVLHTIAIHT